MKPARKPWSAMLSEAYRIGFFLHNLSARSILSDRLIPWRFRAYSSLSCLCSFRAVRGSSFATGLTVK